MIYENIYVYVLVEFYEDIMLFRLFFFMIYRVKFFFFIVWNVFFLFIYVIFNEWVMYNFMYGIIIGVFVLD